MLLAFPLVLPLQGETALAHSVTLGSSTLRSFFSFARQDSPAATSSSDRAVTLCHKPASQL